MRILFLGDVVGEIGREAVRFLLPRLLERYEISFCIVNGENVSNGRGITERDYLVLLESGADTVTLGNHYLGKKEIKDYITDADRLIRPLNSKHIGGEGSIAYDLDGTTIRVTNLCGTAFMKEEFLNPIETLENLLSSSEPNEIHIVDYHGESTSEKAVLAHYFDGRVSAVLGTHTHVQTNDPTLLPKGTAFLSDAGFCGYEGGIIGFDPNSVIEKVVDGSKNPFVIPRKGRAVLEGAILEFEEGSSLFPKSIKLLKEHIDV